jgi:3-phenylpropionate/trans-cinnamate dioxygenase ferredoxin component
MKPRTRDRLAHAPKRAYAEQPVPALGFGYRLLTRVSPQGRVPVTERDGELYLGG